ncbi:Type III pantothenate kinase [Helicobacter mustelae]|uniref:Type III pantothenate kinase n=2 Tax=Helicobacter mustelae TaxID=217 RepID=D3UI34_HELM1|nr:type III pantothenate kinase [Helicobacter mustelae]CBG40157.1 putative Type III pantothenate kinase [Helicobacter mustelae 12198]SQH71659.1 Type III pantothenate kinase [Helicobacter mustelae]STP12784.1 Type III pantothenate kinase [Helicobacter mustelae]
MILCDIGNTHLHFYNQKSIWRVLPEHLNKSFLNDEIYYISVCREYEERLLKMSKRCCNVGSLISIDTSYAGLGVDRRAACVSVRDGVVIDAGSAITIDIMEDSTHLGGCILPGLYAYSNAFAEISPALKKPLHFQVSLEDLPQATQDAMSFGVLKGISLLVADMAKDKKIYITGGDGKFFSKLLPNSIYDEMLIFRGMEACIQKAIQKGVL